MNTITRKIQIHLNEDENRKEHYADIYRWQRICVKAANMIATAHYVQDSIKDLFYLEDGTKKKLGDIKKDEDGILTMSSANTTYQLLSRNFKGDCPMIMLSGLNNIVQKTFKKENLDVKNGKKSLRTYRDNIPMPLPSQSITNLSQQENGNFKFKAFGKNFVTAFGRDASGNRLIMERALIGRYKLCDSAIQLDGTKMFLLAVFQFESEKVELIEDKVMIAELGIAVPIVCSTTTKVFKIGNSEEYLYRSLRIQSTRKQLQMHLKYAKGGKGRSKKLSKLNDLEKVEVNYVRNRMHNYSRELINLCIKNKCGKLVLMNEKPNQDEEPLLFRNWGYSGLKEFIEYKAKSVGIVVEEVKPDKDKNKVQNELLELV